MTPTTRLPLVERLRQQATANDHERGCQGREYSCECGYDRQTEVLMQEAAALIEKQGAQIETLNRLATDRQYFMWAYENMLMEKGLEVVKMWRDKNVKRVHHSWGDEAHKLTGEERAAFILEWEAAPRTRVHDLDAIAAKTLGERE